MPKIFFFLEKNLNFPSKSNLCFYFNQTNLYLLDRGCGIMKCSDTVTMFALLVCSQIVPILRYIVTLRTRIRHAQMLGLFMPVQTGRLSRHIFTFVTRKARFALLKFSWFPRLVRSFGRRGGGVVVLVLLVAHPVGLGVGNLSFLASRLFRCSNHRLHQGRQVDLRGTARGLAILAWDAFVLTLDVYLQVTRIFCDVGTQTAGIPDTKYYETLSNNVGINKLIWKLCLSLRLLEKNSLEKIRVVLFCGYTQIWNRLTVNLCAYAQVPGYW